MKKIIPALFVLATAGLLFAACKSEAQASASPASLASLRQSITVDGTGFHPTEVAAKAGQNVTLVFRRVTDATCGTEVVFKDLGIKKALPLNQDVAIDVKATGTPIGFACGMDMMHGKIVAQ
jgi:plastocyanin domain-containing protein